MQNNSFVHSNKQNTFKNEFKKKKKKEKKNRRDNVEIKFVL